VFGSKVRQDATIATKVAIPKEIGKPIRKKPNQNQMKSGLTLP
jgi:hypothetical protein